MAQNRVQKETYTSIGQLTFNKGAKGERTGFAVNGAQTRGCPCAKE